MMQIAVVLQNAQLYGIFIVKGAFALVEKLIDIAGLPAAVTDTLLADISTKENIILATDTYEELGDGFADTAQMNAGTLIWNADLIQPRIQKSLEAQAQRTRKKAEVFTPAWLCNKMNNHCDEEWFGRENVFNCENSDNTWTPVQSRVEFPEGRKWQQYVDSRRLEITCGEAPYLASRYDVSTGEIITPLTKRIGLLDRKLRVVSENAADDDEWLNWSLRALQSVYGYEYQGDNLLIARINILNTFCDYYEERFKAQAGKQLLKKAAKIITRNIWQMDGLKGTVPLGKPYEEFGQMSLFDELEETTEREAVPCMIYDWRSKVYLKFNELREMQTMGKKMFDYVIGNPPYQETSKGEKPADESVYNYFMDAAYSVCDKVELITPARFLFNAGSTPCVEREDAE